MYICKSKILVHVRKKDGLIVIRYMGCHNRNCPDCQKIKAKKYVKLLSKTPVLFYKVVPTVDVSAILQRIRRSGEFYWKCGLPGKTSVIITTKAISEKWIPFPNESDDSQAMLSGWLSEQVGNVSSTRTTKNGDRARDEYCTYTGLASMPIQEAMTLGNYSLLSNNVYIPNGTPNFEIVEDVLNLSVMI